MLFYTAAAPALALTVRAPPIPFPGPSAPPPRSGLYTLVKTCFQQKRPRPHKSGPNLHLVFKLIQQCGINNFQKSAPGDLSSCCRMSVLQSSSPHGSSTSFTFLVGKVEEKEVGIDLITYVAMGNVVSFTALSMLQVHFAVGSRPL